MIVTRRDFFRTSAAFGAGLALTPAAFAQTGVSDAGAVHPPDRVAPRKMLILGGTGLIGPNMVRYAVERGHEVTIFTRGRAEADIPAVEHLIGDRNDDLSALEGRRWDVVFDNNTSRDYKWVDRSTELLKDAVEHYIFVSSISAYASEAEGYELKDTVLWTPAINEESPRFSPPPGWKHGDDAHYGLMKTISEDTVRAAFPGRSTIVRPGLIVGPLDRTDRFTYWPLRIEAGGEVLAPGNPEHANQIIDQRDLTEWMVRIAEGGVTGVFNATGPASRMSMAEMLYGIRGATSSGVRFTWVKEDFLEANSVTPWGDLPSWIPGDPLMFVDISRALETGLTFRPLADTTRDVLAWDHARPEQERANRRAGLGRERERELLEKWHAMG